MPRCTGGYRIRTDVPPSASARDAPRINAPIMIQDVCRKFLRRPVRSTSGERLAPVRQIICCCWQKVHYGGRYLMFLCSECSRSARVLYARYFYDRICFFTCRKALAEQAKRRGSIYRRIECTTFAPPIVAGFSFAPPDPRPCHQHFEPGERRVWASTGGKGPRKCGSISTVLAFSATAQRATRPARCASCCGPLPHCTQVERSR